MQATSLGQDRARPQGRQARRKPQAAGATVNSARRERGQQTRGAFLPCARSRGELGGGRRGGVVDADLGAVARDVARGGRPGAGTVELAVAQYDTTEVEHRL